MQYRNVTISGLPGAGSSTLGKGLAEKLGWEYFSGGDFMRAYAIEKGLFDKDKTVHHDATVYSDDFDREVDYGMREKMRTRGEKVYDSWLCGFLAQGISGVLKILVTCSDDAVRIDRIVNRDQVTIEEAKKHIFDREQKNLLKWRRMYAKEWEEWVVRRGIVVPNDPIDFWNPKLYDLVIDTFSTSKEETLRLALEALGYVETH